MKFCGKFRSWFIVTWRVNEGLFEILFYNNSVHIIYTYKFIYTELYTTRGLSQRLHNIKALDKV